MGGNLPPGASHPVLTLLSALCLGLWLDCERVLPGKVKKQRRAGGSRASRLPCPMEGNVPGPQSSARGATKVAHSSVGIRA